jgi:hypothetical protein
MSAEDHWTSGREERERWSGGQTRTVQSVVTSTGIRGRAAVSGCQWMLQRSSLLMASAPAWLGELESGVQRACADFSSFDVVAGCGQ